MNTQAGIHNEAEAAVRSGGRRYTQNLRSIVSVLADVGQPLTIKGILERSDGLFASSAYRSLSTLEEVGVVRRLPVNAERALFELSERLGGHHHHLICGSCGEVADVVLDSFTESAVTRGLSEAADEVGFSVDQHTVDAIGRCAACTDS